MFRPNVIFCGKMGSKHQLTNLLNNFTDHYRHTFIKFIFTANAYTEASPLMLVRLRAVMLYIFTASHDQLLIPSVLFRPLKNLTTLNMTSATANRLMLPGPPSAYFFTFTYFYCTVVLSQFHFSHGKFGLLSPGKAS